MNKIDFIILAVLIILLNIGIFLYWLTLPNVADPENEIKKKGRIKFAWDNYVDQIKREAKEILTWIFYLALGYLIIRFMIFKLGIV